MSDGSPEEVLRLAHHFMESRILLSAAELNLFTTLNPVPLFPEVFHTKTFTTTI